MASRLVRTPSAAISGACSGDEQEQEAEREHDADHERRLRGERLLEVVVLGGGAADERARRERGAEPVDRAADGRARRVGVRDRLDEREAVAARLRRRDAGDAGVAAGSGRDGGGARAAGATICSAPGAPAPNACWTCA